ncbi:hypothetical protein K8I28_16490 [bacterium]|nr:hypothetical protein [bacterium]
MKNSKEYGQQNAIRGYKALGENTQTAAATPTNGRQRTLPRSGSSSPAGNQAKSAVPPWKRK